MDTSNHFYILIVDDHPYWRDEHLKYLTGYDLTRANNANQAISSAKTSNFGFDVIIINLCLTDYGDDLARTGLLLHGLWEVHNTKGKHPKILLVSDQKQSDLISGIYKLSIEYENRYESKLVYKHKSDLTLPLSYEQVIHHLIHGEQSSKQNDEIISIQISNQEHVLITRLIGEHHKLEFPTNWKVITMATILDQNHTKYLGNNCLSFGISYFLDEMIELIISSGLIDQMCMLVHYAGKFAINIDEKKLLDDLLIRLEKRQT